MQCFKRYKPFYKGAAKKENYEESGQISQGPVGRARKRINELLEDSFNIFGSKEIRKSKEFHRTAYSGQRERVFGENRGKSAQVR